VASPEKDKPTECSESGCSDCKCKCECKTEKPKCGCDDKKERWVMGGLRMSVLSLSGSDRDGTHVGFMFAGAGDYFTDGGGSHVGLNYLLGGGSAGFEGALGGDVLAGYRADVGEHHGPFARAGFEGQMIGNDLFYHSTLELPAMRAGYNYAWNGVVFELGGRGGPVLAGRYNPGEHGYRRLSGSIEYGAYVFAKTEHVKLSIMARRFDARMTGDGTPVDVGTAMLCAGGGKFQLCADGTIMRGHVMQDGGGPHYLAQTNYGGLTFSWTSNP
jgi:hypothetical protein